MLDINSHHALSRLHAGAGIQPTCRVCPINRRFHEVLRCGFFSTSDLIGAPGWCIQRTRNPRPTAASQPFASSQVLRRPFPGTPAAPGKVSAGGPQVRPAPGVPDGAADRRVALRQQGPRPICGRQNEARKAPVDRTRFFGRNRGARGGLGWGSSS